MTIREAQGVRENTRYPLIRLINQAFTLWKPNEKNVEDRNLLWTVEGVLHTFVTDEGLLQDQVLFIETFDIWNHLLTAQSLRPLFATEREKSQGDSLPFLPTTHHVRGRVNVDGRKMEIVRR